MFPQAHDRDMHSSGGIGAVQQFYDDLANTYHLCHTDWEMSIRTEGPALHRILTSQLGTGPHRVLDCACGIGTQLVGLAQHGHQVTGSDFSENAVRRATKEIAQRGLAANIHVADMRALPFNAHSFDAVVCANNSLPHLLEPSAVLAAARSMRRVLRPGGMILITTRDYDALHAAQPTGTPPVVVETPEERTITIQVWSWRGEHYDLEHLQIVSNGTDWKVQHRVTPYWAVTRQQLTEMLTAAGFTGLCWHEPESTGYFQPILTATI
ncbi:class I SAM-dependent methyltransferase [Streptomyces sp. NPDC127084]|uniref:class I SAM-dependent methyltransferase n=1 Tax=Streptomyces sp. NPDC127084 TaxID=3347133 RepID=UPI00365BAE40